MSYGDIVEPIKSCIWLGFETFNLPLEVLTRPAVIGSLKDSVKFGFLEDVFEIYFVKALPKVFGASVYRNRENPNETPDDGYALRFDFTLIGFDEEPQTAIMKHDDRRSEPVASFDLTENILAKINTTHHVFELFVVVHMLEFKSIHKNDEKKKNIDGYMSHVKSRLSKKGVRDLSFILKSPGLKNTFTGRLPKEYFSSIIEILALMEKNYGIIAEYLRKRENRAFENSKLDVYPILKCIGIETDEGTVPPEEAIERYLLVHKLGFDCLKTITSDYLVSILDNDYDVLDVLEASLMVHDKDLFEKAITSFLNRFHEITRSGKFQYFTRCKAVITRLIIHSARVWVANNDVYIPTWVQTTEL